MEGNDRKRRKICPHCTQNISYSAYLSHKARYYDRQSCQWTSANEAGTDLHDESLIQSDCEDPLVWNEDISVEPDSDASTTDLGMDDEDQDYEALEVGS